MYDPICDVISCCVWRCDMGKIYAYDKIVMKKRENMEIEKIILNSPSIRRFWNGIYSLLMRPDARGSADIIYCIWRMSLLFGLGIVNDVTKLGRAQNIYYQRIVLQCLIHTLTLRRNLIPLAIFNAIFLKFWWWLTFWGPPYRHPTEALLLAIPTGLAPFWNIPGSAPPL